MAWMFSLPPHPYHLQNGEHSYIAEVTMQNASEVIECLLLSIHFVTIYDFYIVFMVYESSGAT